MGMPSSTQGSCLACRYGINPSGIGITLPDVISHAREEISFIGYHRGTPSLRLHA